MRIIAGKFKGAALESPSGEETRPTADRLRETALDILGKKIAGAAVLDLFAGTGALGIESLSRGAKRAVFNDISTEAADLIKKNLKKVRCEAEVFNQDYKTALKTLSGEKFDVIFLDPPYGKNYEDEALKIIQSNGLLEEDGLIVVERDGGLEPFSLPVSFEETDKRISGKAALSIVEKKTKAAVTGTFDPVTNGHLFLIERALEKFDSVRAVVLINPDKKMRFSLDKRLYFLQKAIKKYRGRVKADYYPGMTVDYCRKFGVEYIVRGVRSPADFRYECEMAEYNFLNGGIRTLIIPAEDGALSSSLVRRFAAEGKSLEGLVDPSIIKEIEREGRNGRY
jgi:RNA methyltransferase, RsmD family/pantetheine-phosphate adenylyltransferase, bacterial